MTFLQWIKYIFSEKYKKNIRIIDIAMKRIGELKLH